MGMKAKSYHDLVAWQKAIALAKETHKHIYKLPKEERFELGSQMRRAAVSIPSNKQKDRHGVSQRSFAIFFLLLAGLMLSCKPS